MYLVRLPQEHQYNKQYKYSKKQNTIIVLRTPRYSFKDTWQLTTGIMRKVYKQLNILGPIQL